MKLTLSTFKEKVTDREALLALLGLKKTYSIPHTHFAVYNFYKQNIGTQLDKSPFDNRFVRAIYEDMARVQIRRQYNIGPWRVYFNTPEEQMSFLLKWS